MVKGNWERRAELAANRRLENREKKKNSKEKVATGESVRARLLSPKFVTNPSNILVWCVSGEQRAVCSNWFRADSCTLKKCKLGHRGATVSHLRDVYRGELPLETPSERMCDPPVPLESLPARDSNLIHFVAINNRCVFDYLFPEVWNTFLFECVTLAVAASDTTQDSTREDTAQNIISTQNEAAKATDTVLSLVPVRGRARTISADQNILQHANLLHAVEGETAAQAPGSASLLDSAAFLNLWKSSGACAHILSFLPDKDMMQVSLCNKDLRKQCLENSTFRHRKREYFSRVAGTYSKSKKAEQKKKKVQAHTKTLSKKDEFARGNSGGRGRG